MTYLANDTRRRFIHRMASAFAAGGGLAALGQLGMIDRALAARRTPPSDYRALVCVYLTGGNDSFNLVVPRDNPRYDRYQAVRDALAVPRDQLLTIDPAGGGDYGLHPSCSGLQTLFEQRRLALVANVGTLVAPMNKTQYINNTVPRPPQLFSHNSQAKLWNIGTATADGRRGWGGLLGDRLVAFNGNQSLPLSLSIAGNNLFGVGASLRPYQLSAGGTVPVFRYHTNTNIANQARLAAFEEIFSATYANPLQREYSAIMNRSIEFDALVGGALQETEISTVFPADNTLAAQMRMVARLIKARDKIDQRRQVFYVNLGGFDTHNDQIDDQPRLLAQLSEALAAFQQAMIELNTEADVTTFTMSDFGRTLSSNGDGSDHGWGGHQMVVGGAVQGGDLYGVYPQLELDGPDSVGRGRMIPTTAVDQFAATLARWMGVDEDDINAIFPSLDRFDKPDLGFFKTA